VLGTSGVDLPDLSSKKSALPILLGCGLLLPRPGNHPPSSFPDIFALEKTQKMPQCNFNLSMSSIKLFYFFSFQKKNIVSGLRKNEPIQTTQ
jgi:hypothetical protein